MLRVGNSLPPYYLVHHVWPVKNEAEYTKVALLACALMENDKWHVNSRAKWVSPEMTKKTLLATGEHSRGTEVSTNLADLRFSYYKSSWILMVWPYIPLVFHHFSLGLPQSLQKKWEISIFKLTFIDQIIFFVEY